MRVSLSYFPVLFITHMQRMHVSVWLFSEDSGSQEDNTTCLSIKKAYQQNITCHLQLKRPKPSTPHHTVRLLFFHPPLLSPLSFMPSHLPPFPLSQLCCLPHPPSLNIIPQPSFPPLPAFVSFFSFGTPSLWDAERTVWMSYVMVHCGAEVPCEKSARSKIAADLMPQFFFSCVNSAH